MEHLIDFLDNVNRLPGPVASTLILFGSIGAIWAFVGLVFAPVMLIGSVL